MFMEPSNRVFKDFSKIAIFTPFRGPQVQNLNQKYELVMKREFSESVRVRKLKFGTNDVCITITGYITIFRFLPPRARGTGLTDLIGFCGSHDDFYPSAKRGIVIIMSV